MYMKKYKIYLIVAVIILFIPIIYKMTITHHKVTYEKDKYRVEETFEIKDKKHIYTLDIQKGKQEYSFQIENKVNKRKKIVKSIKTYQEKKITCIVPTVINQKEKEIYCTKDNLQVSKEVLKEDKDFQKILKKAKITIEEEDRKTKNYKNMKVYQANIPEYFSLIIWNYKGINLLSQKELKEVKILNHDLYDNIEATLTSRYFVLLENTPVEGIQKIYAYDKKKEKVNQITLENRISKDSYINGVEDDLVYITDRKAKKQYTLNVKKEELKEVSTEEGYIKFTDHKKQVLSITDFFEKDEYFENERILNKKITKSKDLVKENNIYYFKEENTFYRQIPGKNKVKLMEKENVEEWNLVGDKILFRIENQLYLFDEKEGIKVLLEYNELKYNAKNIYYLWK